MARNEEHVRLAVQSIDAALEDMQKLRAAVQTVPSNDDVLAFARLMATASLTRAVWLAGVVAGESQ